MREGDRFMADVHGAKFIVIVDGMRGESDAFDLG